MSLFGSMSSGVSGLRAQSEAMGVISDNLANVNTIGYKNTRTLFDQQVTSAGLSGTLFNSGGVGTEFSRFQNAQGTMISTQSSTDLALSGSGFFVVADDTEIGADTGLFYTRAGAFTEDNRGFLSTEDGQHLLGWRTESDGTIVDVQNPQPIELQSVSSSARASSELEIGFNLTSGEEVHSYDTTASLQSNIDAVVSDPTTADFVTDVRFYDSAGGSRDVSMAFVKRSNNLWDWIAYTDGESLISDVNGNPTVAGSNAQIGGGQLHFNNDGSLKYASNSTMTVNWAGGVDQSTITTDFGSYTGGNIFDNAAAGSNMEYTDGILGVTMSDSHGSTPATIPGNYTFENLGAVAGGYNIQLTEPDGSTFTAVMPTATENRILEFGNGVTVAVSSAFNAATAWVGVGNEGTVTMPAVSQVALNDGGGSDGVVQFDSAYNARFANQNGFGSGTLSAISVDSDGFVIGSFTNGETKRLWKTVVAVFQDPTQLEPIGNNMYRATDASGPPLYKEAGVNGTAEIVSGALEQSTVDIAGEFSNMIVSQRAFQASSTIITTVDQMLNELLQVR